ncbi:MAG: hypothetical protein HYV04_05670 [Deltaproteobacteria bacterium]|nr:hypothetical protein [Deltaproteobacteria bacterium]
MNSMRGWINGDEWYFTLRQPVLTEPTGGKHPAEIYLDLAERVGVIDEFLKCLNDTLGLKESFRLKVGQKYSPEEVIDRHIRSFLGAEIGLDKLKERGFVAFPRTMVEKFPRALTKLPRAHLYFEFLLEAGQQLESIATEAALTLDTRGFQPLPCWYPCAAQVQAAPAYDLFAVNYKLPFHTTTMTQDNPWLAGLAVHHPVGYRYLLNTQTAARKGIADGDEVSLETPTGASACGIVKLSQCIHPEVIGIASSFGHWGQARKAGRHRGTHFNSLVPYRVSQIDAMAGLLDACVKVKVSKASAR